MKKALYNRKLDCGHERITSIAFFCENYRKPLVGEICYCRECCREVEIVEVVKLTDKDILKEEEENNTLFGTNIINKRKGEMK